MADFADDVREAEELMRSLCRMSCLHRHTEEITLDNEWKNPAKVCRDCGRILGITIVNRYPAPE